jgi:cytochrome P450
LFCHVAETLRKYPPVSIMSRKCTKDYRIPGSHATVEKGTEIIIPIEALHRDPQYYPEPDRFDPERFNEEVQSRRHHYVYLPFGEGPRICLGNYTHQLRHDISLCIITAAWCLFAYPSVCVCNVLLLPLSLQCMSMKPFT